MSNYVILRIRIYVESVYHVQRVLLNGIFALQTNKGGKISGQPTRLGPAYFFLNGPNFLPGLLADRFRFVNWIGLAQSCTALARYGSTYARPSCSKRLSWRVFPLKLVLSKSIFKSKPGSTKKPQIDPYWDCFFFFNKCVCPRSGPLQEQVSAKLGLCLNRFGLVWYFASK